MKKGNAMFNNSKHIKEVADLYKSVGNFQRLQIISLLIGGEKNVTELNKAVKISQPAISQHLGYLRRVNILDKRRDHRNIYYFIKNPHVLRLLGVGIDAVKGEKNGQ